jgi:hypothetical protein
MKRTEKDEMTYCKFEKKLKKLNFAQFALSQLQIHHYYDENNQKQQVYKLNMYGKNDLNDKNVTLNRQSINDKSSSIISLHSSHDNLSDSGLAVEDHKCWYNMVNFFKKINVSQKVFINSNNNTTDDESCESGYGSNSVNVIIDLIILND